MAYLDRALLVPRLGLAAFQGFQVQQVQQVQKRGWMPVPQE